MAVRATTTWLTACLHYNEPWEEFLVKAVKPYADVVMQTGVAERFHFQRSWERGPHIRLWFKGSADILEKMLLPNLVEHFSQYFEARPSFLVEPQYPADFSDSYKWFPNNSVQHFRYEPELDRYGGRLELSLCEKQYQASSLAVLKTIKDKASRWTHNEMMSAAIKLHLSFAYAVGMPLEEAGEFFHLLCEDWRLKNLKSENGASPAQNGGASLRSFQKIFDIQKKDIVPYHAALWELFASYHSLEDKSFVRWFDENASVAVELSLAIESGKLKPRRGFPAPGTLDSPEQEQLWSYFAEFVLLTNNRLGIHHKNEGYLFYVLDQSLRLVATTAPLFARVAV